MSDRQAVSPLVVEFKHWCGSHYHLEVFAVGCAIVTAHTCESCGRYAISSQPNHAVKLIPVPGFTEDERTGRTLLAKMNARR